MSIEKAKELLSKTTISVNGVAGRLGYNVKEFNRAFASRTGFYPVEYRRKYGDPLLYGQHTRHQINHCVVNETANLYQQNLVRLCDHVSGFKILSFACNLPHWEWVRNCNLTLVSKPNTQKLEGVNLFPISELQPYAITVEFNPATGSVSVIAQHSVTKQLFKIKATLKIELTIDQGIPA